MRFYTQTPVRIQNVDPPPDFMIITIGVLESKTPGSTCWILSGGLGTHERTVDNTEW